MFENNKFPSIIFKNVQIEKWKHNYVNNMEEYKNLICKDMKVQIYFNIIICFDILIATISNMFIIKG